jgi:hypothetical protein
MQLTASIIDLFDDHKDAGYFYAAGFLTFLMFNSFLCTWVLRCYDQDNGSKLTTGYREELEVFS